MHTIARAWKVELDPTVKQRRLLEQWAGISRAIYNSTVAEIQHRQAAKRLAKGLKVKPTEAEKAAAKEAVKIRKAKTVARKAAAVVEGRSPYGGRKAGIATRPPDLTSTSPNDLRKAFLADPSRYGSSVEPPVERPYLRNVSSFVYRETISDAKGAFDRFYDRLSQGMTVKEAGYPKFKKRGKAKPKFRIEQSGKVTITDRHVILPNSAAKRVPKDIRTIRLRRRGYIPTDGVKYIQYAFSREGGCWYVSVSAYVDIDDVQRDHKDVIGVDFGLRTRAMPSSGAPVNIDDPTIPGLANTTSRLTHLRKRLVEWQRRAARRWTKDKKQSRRYEKAINKVRALHHDLNGVQRNLTHQMSRQIVNRGHGVIVVEDLNIAGMLQNHRLARHIQEARWGAFRRQLEYKQAWAGGTTSKCWRFFPSSKRCNKCGNVKDDLGTARVYRCDVCGHVDDRDLNAAKNQRDWILLGLKDSWVRKVPERPLDGGRKLERTAQGIPVTGEGGSQSPAHADRFDEPGSRCIPAEKPGGRPLEQPDEFSILLEWGRH